MPTKRPRRTVPSSRKGKTWYWVDPVYHAGIALLKQSPEAASAWLERNGLGDASPFDGQAGRTIFTAGPQGTGVVIWLPLTWKRDIDGIVALAHECTHAALGVLQHRGLVVCDASEEAVTYYQGWILSECLRRLS